jgi:hypothetical protein
MHLFEYSCALLGIVFHCMLFTVMVCVNACVRVARVCRVCRVCVSCVSVSVQLVSKPQAFDVMVTPNFYGSLVSNCVAGGEHVSTQGFVTIVLS